METMTVQVLLTELETARDSLDKALACLVTAPKILNRERRILGKPCPTIKFVTENGFTIERTCEREKSPTDSASGCHFVVRGPDHRERRVTVVFGEAAIRLVQSLQSSPLALDSPLWICRAERYLATYLWKENDFPLHRHLTIDQLSAQNVRLSRST
jgi:hypothetical protein